jgi:anti-anti-sigma regulatory factor
MLGLLDSGHKNLIVNLKNITDIDTVGVGTLAMCATKFKEAGGRLVLVDLDDSHTKVWDTLKLNTVLDIFSDELSAVNSFFPERAVAHYDILEFVEEQEHKKALAERS